MISGSDVFKGVIHGRVIELEESPNLPTGQPVTVVVHPANGHTQSALGEGLRRSAGAWSDEPDALEQYLRDTRQFRKQDRQALEP